MVSGLPDYKSDIRPEQGAAKSVFGKKTVVLFDLTTLLKVDGKGIVYGGVVWLEYTASQKTSIVYALIDGSYVQSYSFLRLQRYGIFEPRSVVITLNAYDDVNFIYSVGVSYGITFNKSFELVYSEQAGDTPDVNYNLVYSLL